MIYSVFTDICDKLGNHNLPSNERWKSIKFIHSDAVSIYDFQNLYRNKQAYFIGDGTGPTGFIILEKNANEFSISNVNTITFIDIDSVFTLSFMCEADYDAVATILFEAPELTDGVLYIPQAYSMTESDDVLILK